MSNEKKLPDVSFVSTFSDYMYYQFGITDQAPTLLPKDPCEPEVIEPLKFEMLSTPHDGSCYDWHCPECECKECFQDDVEMLQDCDLGWAPPVLQRAKKFDKELAKKLQAVIDSQAAVNTYLESRRG